jgi:ribosome maturation factor RimP
MGPAGPFFFEKDEMATTYEKERNLHSEIAPRVEHDLPGVEVLAVELASPDRFVVYVDHPDGVDHALCVRVTDLLRDYLREYTVDVSSPGIERPLRKPSHFADVIGRKVKVRTSEKQKLKGEVVAAHDTHVTIDENEIPYERIVRANLIDER